VNVHYIPVHHQPYYRRQGVAYDPLPEAEAYYREAISLPMFAGLTDEAQDRVVAALRDSL
jgi:dTDP-4-amino-4,6-dideoxygalactose transaminase